MSLTNIVVLTCGKNIARGIITASDNWDKMVFLDRPSAIIVFV